MEALRRFWNQPTAGDAAKKRIAVGRPWPWDENECIEFLGRLINGPTLAGETVLDFGAGIGRLARPAVTHFKAERVFAADVSETMILQGMGYCQGLPVDFFLTDGDNVGGVEPETCDRAYSALCFQHMPNEAMVISCLHAIRNSLKIGGEAHVQFSRVGSRRPLRKISFFGIKHHPKHHPNLFRKAGLMLRSIRPWGSKWFVCDAIRMH